MFDPDGANGWGAPQSAASSSLQHPGKRVFFERIAKLEVSVQHGVSIVTAELLGPGGMNAAVHAGRHGAAPEAVAAQFAPVEVGSYRALLHDAGDGSGIDRVGSDDS